MRERARRPATKPRPPVNPDARCADCKFAKPVDGELMCHSHNSLHFGGLVDSNHNCAAFDRKEDGK